MEFEIGSKIRDLDGIEYMVQEWSIEDILKTVVLSADFYEFDGTPSMWAYILSSKSGDKETPVLLEKILAEGFTVPICLWQDKFGNWGIGNGHHRLACAIMLGMDKIPVFVSDEIGESYPIILDGPDLPEGDEDFADTLHLMWYKVYKTLAKQEARELDEDGWM